MKSAPRSATTDHDRMPGTLSRRSKLLVGALAAFAAAAVFVVAHLV